MAGTGAAAGTAASRTDAELVAAAQGADAQALEELLRRHQDRIHALCRRITGDDDTGLDATQEAMIAIARGIGRFDGRSSFSTWVYRVATNAALDEARRRKRRPIVLATFAGSGDDGLPDARDPWPPSNPSTSDHAAFVAERIDVDSALSLIPDDQRAAVVLRDLLDFDYATIAEILGVPAGTVRSRIARGRAALAGVIRPDEGDHDSGWNRETADGRQNDGETSGRRP